MRAALDIAGKHDIPFIEHRLSGGGVDRSAMFMDPIHPNSGGNRLIAEDLGKYILKHIL